MKTQASDHKSLHYCYKHKSAGDSKKVNESNINVASSVHSLKKSDLKETHLLEPSLNEVALSRVEVARMSERLNARMKRMRPRCGLVRNYLITRGAAVDTQLSKRKLSEHFAKFTGKLTKLLTRSDFKDEHTFSEFDCIMKTLSAAARKGAKPEVTQLLNKPYGKKRNTILHKLIKKRQLKFVKSLLRHCGHYINMDHRNKHQQNALDMAYDRLETEIAFLLIAYGAKLHVFSHKNHLRWGEFLQRDMLGNIDTGRWLHKKDIRAMIKHAQQQDAF